MKPLISHHIGVVRIKHVTSDETGKTVLMLGNEAVVRGAIEAGMDFAAAYPGTPSSEIGDTMYRVAGTEGFTFEFSVNEMVAMQVAYGTAVTGLRSMTFFKLVGLNVAADAFMTTAYNGTVGGFVILSADDPSCHSSQNEQDNRYFGRIAGMPVLEPATVQEMKDFTKTAFELSERFELPVLIRTTTRVNHARGPVVLGEKGERRGKGRFERDMSRYVLSPAHARRRREWNLGQMAKLAEYAETSPLNTVEEYGDGNGGGKGVGGRKGGEDGDANGGGPVWGIAASGVSYAYVKDALGKGGLGARFRVLRLGLSYPLPEKKILDFLGSVEGALVVEEVEPILETEISALAKRNGLALPIKGKLTGDLPDHFEYNPLIVRKGICSAVGTDDGGAGAGAGADTGADAGDGGKGGEGEAGEPLPLPGRPPALCPGCPHRGAFHSAKKAAGKDGVFPTDIGCYTLGIMPPQRMGDIMLCMGSSVGTAAGIAGVTDQKVIGFIGDSTFYHAGIPPLIDAVHHGKRFVLCIMDNHTTAMTGHQPTPAMGGEEVLYPAHPVDMEKLVEGLGIGFVRVVDPNDLKATRAAFEEALEHDGVAVVITRRPCALLDARARRKAGDPLPVYQVDQELCIRCHTCIRYGCPATYKDIDNTDDKGKIPAQIDATLCLGCGVCAELCPKDAIGVVKR